MGAAASIVLPGILRPGDAAAAAAPVSDQLMAQQLCWASAFDARGGLRAVGNPVAEVAEGGIAARSNDRIELGKSGGFLMYTVDCCPPRLTICIGPRKQPQHPAARVNV